jgi:hypothetical protein
MRNFTTDDGEHYTRYIYIFDPSFIIGLVDGEVTLCDLEWQSLHAKIIRFAGRNKIFLDGGLYFGFSYSSSIVRDGVIGYILHVGSKLNLIPEDTLVYLQMKGYL